MNIVYFSKQLFYSSIKLIIACDSLPGIPIGFYYSEVENRTYAGGIQNVTIIHI